MGTPLLALFGGTLTENRKGFQDEAGLLTTCFHPSGFISFGGRSSLALALVISDTGVPCPEPTSSGKVPQTQDKPHPRPKPHLPLKSGLHPQALPPNPHFSLCSLTPPTAAGAPDSPRPTTSALHQARGFFFFFPTKARGFCFYKCKSGQSPLLKTLNTSHLPTTYTKS